MNPHTLPVLVRIGVPTFGITRQAHVHGQNPPWLYSANALFDHRSSYFRDVSSESHQGAALDSAGFVAMRRYGGYPWSLEDYAKIGALNPWDWWASMDFCCEPEIAADAQEVRCRVERTAKTLGDLLAEVDDLRDGGAHWAADPMPVLQGWSVDAYRRSIELTDKQLGGTWPELVGLGSVCRRKIHGRDGLLAVFRAVAAELPRGVRLHLFGVKSQALRYLARHPRLASVDSCAWDVQARWDALRGGYSNTLAHRGGVMGKWYAKQIAILVDANKSKPGELDLFG